MLELQITVDGLRELIRDLSTTERQIAAIVLSEYDKNDIKYELENTGTKVTMEDREKAPQLGELIAIVENVPILSHKEISRGHARIVFRENGRLSVH